MVLLKVFDNNRNGRDFDSGSNSGKKKSFLQKAALSEAFCGPHRDSILYRMFVFC